MELAESFVVHSQRYATARTKQDVRSWEVFLNSFKQDNNGKAVCLAVIRNFPMQIEGLLAGQTLRDMCRRNEAYSEELYEEILGLLTHFIPTHDNPVKCLHDTPIQIHPILSQLFTVVSILLIQRLLSEGNSSSSASYLTALPRILDQFAVSDASRLQFAPWIVLEVFSVLPEQKPPRLPGALGRGGLEAVLLAGGLQGVMGFITHLLSNISHSSPNLPMGLYLCGLRCLCAWASFAGEASDGANAVVFLPLLGLYIDLYERVLAEVMVRGRSRVEELGRLLVEDEGVPLLMGGVGEAFRLICEAAAECKAEEAADRHHVLARLAAEGGRLCSSVKELVFFTLPLSGRMWSVCQALLAPLLEGAESVVRSSDDSSDGSGLHGFLGPLLSPLLEMLQGAATSRARTSEPSALLALASCALPLWSLVVQKTAEQGAGVWGLALSHALTLSTYHPAYLSCSGRCEEYVQAMAEFREELRDLLRVAAATCAASVFDPLLEAIWRDYQSYQQSVEDWAPLEGCLHALSAIARDTLGQLPAGRSAVLVPLFRALSDTTIGCHRPLSRAAAMAMSEMLNQLLLPGHKPGGSGESLTISRQDMQQLVGCWVQSIGDALMHSEEVQGDHTPGFQVSCLGPLPPAHLASLLAVAPQLPFRAKQDHLGAVCVAKLLPQLARYGKQCGESAMFFLGDLGAVLAMRCLPLLCEAWGSALGVCDRPRSMSWKSLSVLLGVWMEHMCLVYLYGAGQDVGVPLWQLLGVVCTAIQGGALQRCVPPDHLDTCLQTVGHDISVAGMAGLYHDMQPPSPYSTPPMALLQLVGAFLTPAQTNCHPPLLLPLSLLLDGVEGLVKCWEYGQGGGSIGGFTLYLHRLVRGLVACVQEIKDGQATAWSEEEIGLLGSIFSPLSKLILLEETGIEQVEQLSALFLTLVTSLSAPPLQRCILVHCVDLYEQSSKTMGGKEQFMLSCLRLLLSNLHDPTLRNTSSTNAKWRGQLDRGLDRPKGGQEEADGDGVSALSLAYAVADLVKAGGWNGLGLHGAVLVGEHLSHISTLIGYDPRGSKRLLELCTALLPVDPQLWAGENRPDFWSSTVSLPLSGLAPASLVETYTSSGVLRNILCTLIQLLRTPVMSAVREGVMRTLVRASVWGGQVVFELFAQVFDSIGGVKEGGKMVARRLFNAAVGGEWKKFRGVLKTLV